MAWARPPGAPQLPKTPLEALEPRTDEYTSIMEPYGYPVLFGAFGGLSPAIVNWYRKAPFYTGLWRHVVLGVSAAYLGFKFRDLLHDIYDDRDEVLRQYISLHPEDFPPYKRILIKDTIDSWEPRR